MGYESDDGGMFAKTSGKRLAILFGLAFFGAFVLLQIVWGFPLWNVFFKETVTEKVAVTIKNGNICVVEPSDNIPRNIDDCKYNKGDQLIITYSKSRSGIESYRSAS